MVRAKAVTQLVAMVAMAALEAAETQEATVEMAAMPRAATLAMPTVVLSPILAATSTTLADLVSHSDASVLGKS